MALVVAYLAAIGCSLCNGISTVQQKIGADHARDVHKLDLAILWRLLKNFQYALGTSLEIIAYVLSLVALRILPLFLVQSLIAASIVVTAIGERLFLHRKLGSRTYVALGIVLAGLISLAISAVPGRAMVSNQTDRILVEILPIPLVLIGLFFISMRNSASAIMLAVLGGLSFGNTSTIGRILVYPHPLWKLVENPLLGSLIISAILGQYFFTVSLQRISATKSNAAMVAMQTLGPAVCGLLLFDDKIRAGFQTVVVLGIVLVIVGSGLTVIDEAPEATI